ncbi:MAG: hypothetical protein ACTHLW_18385 [Verrucomicrobiota bacterium]
MSKKEYILIGLVLVLGGLYVAFFSGWFKPKFIRIEHSVRLSRKSWTGSRTVAAKSPSDVSFVLHNPYRLTSVRVVRAADIATNKFAHSLWHLVSKTGSAPAEGFAYGFPLEGMAPAITGAEPEALEPGTDYLLLLEAGSLKGTNQFTLPQSATAQR